MKPFHAPKRPLFIDPDTGHKFWGKTKVELVQKIVTYRAQNELEPIENLDLVLQDYWCSLPENKWKCIDVRLERGLMKYLKGGISLVKNMIYPKFCSQEEAERRAFICMSCPHNVDREKPEFMQWSDEIAVHAVGDRKTTFDKGLGSCAICTCPLRSKVHYGGKIELPPEEEAKLIPECWQRRENQKELIS